MMHVPAHPAWLALDVAQLVFVVVWAIARHRTHTNKSWGGLPLWMKVSWLSFTTLALARLFYDLSWI
jgi:hypothetical protein